MALEPHRIALILDGDEPAGSGYLLDDRFVLTAEHVVGDEATQIAVRLSRQSEVRPAALAWREPKSDVALLRLEDPVRSEVGRPPEWASVGRTNLKCGAAGYPTFADVDEGGKETPETASFEGRIDSFAGLEFNRQLTGLFTTPPREPEDWKGLSGAGLFVEGLLVGIITHADKNRMLAYPVARLAENKSFVTAWGRAPKVRKDVLWPEEDLGLVDALRGWEVPLPNSRRPAKLLEARYEVVPFEESGREDVLTALETFTNAPARNGVLVLVGPGGSGKTRLLQEWCKRLREGMWLAGLLKSDVPKDLRTLARGTTPRFVVMDYAETDPATARRLLRAMAERSHGPVMRVVLLARGGGPWTRSSRTCWTSTRLCTCRSCTRRGKHRSVAFSMRMSSS